MKRNDLCLHWCNGWARECPTCLQDRVTRLARFKEGAEWRGLANTRRADTQERTEKP